MKNRVGNWPGNLGATLLERDWRWLLGSETTHRGVFGVSTVLAGCGFLVMIAMGCDRTGPTEMSVERLKDREVAAAELAQPNGGQASPQVAVSIPNPQLAGESPAGVEERSAFPDALAAEESGKPPRQRFWLGIQSRPAPGELLDHFDLQCGLVVGHVVPGGPSDSLLQVSDLIYEYNGEALGCQKKLCGCIGSSGTSPVRLSLIRKTARLEVIVQPQPVEWLENGSIIQYTIATSTEGSADGHPADTRVPMAGPDGKLVEKFRLFVAQPPLWVQDKAGGAVAEAAPGKLSLERVASFRTNQDGSQVLVVQEGGRVIEYRESEWGSACQELKELCDLIDRQP
jgi:hypothetical protein